MNILLIDDESAVTDAIQDILKNFTPNKIYGRSLKIDAANDFYSARKFLDNQDPPYDLIISDLLLPRRGADIPNANPYQGNTLTGWFFLCHHILDSGGKYYDKYIDKTIVLFSAYEGVWEQYVTDNQQESFKNKVSLVTKGHNYHNLGNYEVLAEKIKTLFA